MAFDERLAERIRRSLGRRKGFAEKKMFGGVGFLLNGNMCVGVHGSELIVRLAPEATDGALKRAITRRFATDNHPGTADNSMNKQSIWALVAGAVVAIVATTLVDVALHIAHVFPPINDPINDALALLATSYRIVIGVAGAWLTARLAPDKPLKHALILGYLGVALGLVGVVVTWNKGLGPHWYPIALVVLAVPQSWVGGKLYEARAQRRLTSA